jgi:hypothetical protein
MKRIISLIICYYALLLLLICALGLIFYNGFLSFDIVELIFWKSIPAVFVVWIIIFIVIAVINKKQSKKLFNEHNTNTLKSFARIIKLSLIPFWIIYIAGSVVILLCLVIGTRGVGIIIVPVPILLLIFLRMVSLTYSK